MSDEKLTNEAPANRDAPDTPESKAAVKRVIKIGSQRPGHEIKPPQPEPSADDATPAQATTTSETTPDESKVESPATSSTVEAETETAGSTETAFPPPRIQRLSEDVQREVDEALAGLSIEDLLGEGASGGDEKTEIQMDSRYTATVVRVDPEYVFYSLPGRHEGVAAIKHFEDLPEVGTRMEVSVTGYKPDERMYELSIPGAAVDVADWSDIDEGVVIEVTVIGHNTGGLECKVGGIRGFIPISQIALYRVEDCAEFVDQKLRCVVTEANPARGNLVLSHRAYLERERETAREELLSKLEVGQEHEGVVRKIMDFGAFVDIGGVDGLVHISKLSWDRVQHPSEVLTEGEKVKIKIDKIDADTGKLSFSYRDLLEKPWDGAEAKFPVNAILAGTVSKIMPFGAFVRLAPGVEGLVHISELAHHRVTRVDNVVREGQEVNVKVLSVDEANQKMSLSIKGAQAAPPEETKADEETADAVPTQPLPQSKTPLKGGLNKPTGGEDLGLNW